MLKPYKLVEIHIANTDVFEKLQVSCEKDQLTEFVNLVPRYHDVENFSNVPPRDVKFPLPRWLKVFNAVREHRSYLQVVLKVITVR